MRDKLRKGRVRATARSHMQFIADQLAFVDHTAQSLAILQRSRDGKRFGSSSAFGKGVIELCYPDMTSDLGVLLFQVKVSFALGAIR